MAEYCEKSDLYVNIGQCSWFFFFQENSGWKYCIEKYAIYVSFCDENCYNVGDVKIRNVLNSSLLLRYAKTFLTDLKKKTF